MFKKLFIAMVATSILSGSALAVQRPMPGLGGVVAENTNQIKDLNSRMFGMEQATEQLKAGIAGASAIGSLAQPNGFGEKHFAMALAGYDSEYAVAASLSRVVDPQTTFRGIVALDSSNDLTWGASVGYTW